MIRRFINNSDINRFRTYFQAGAFVLLLYGGYLAIDISTNMPTFACPFVENRGGTCYLWPLQHQMNIEISQIFTGRGIAIITGLMTFLFLFILFNKAWCGFICPLGTIQDWITRLRSGLAIPYSIYSEGLFKRLNKVKYGLLILLILLPMGIANLGLSQDLSTPYCMVCPSRTVLPLFSADISQLVIDFSSKTKIVLTTLGMAVTGLFIVGAFVKRRFFCLFCPMSGLQYIFSKAALLRLTKDGTRCTRCGNCYRVCDMGIREIADDIESRDIMKEDCMMCFKCVGACPEARCLEVRFLGMPLYQSTSEGFFKRMNKKALSEETIGQ
ncbi:MAG: hypothetical protein OHK0032_03830 [Thermodesulfovibrionales bacterium]